MSQHPANYEPVDEGFQQSLTSLRSQLTYSENPNHRIVGYMISAYQIVLDQITDVTGWEKTAEVCMLINRLDAVSNLLERIIAGVLFSKEDDITKAKSRLLLAQSLSNEIDRYCIRGLK